MKTRLRQALSFLAFNLLFFFVFLGFVQENAKDEQESANFELAKPGMRDVSVNKATTQQQISTHPAPMAVLQ